MRASNLTDYCLETLIWCFEIRAHYGKVRRDSSAFVKADPMIGLLQNVFELDYQYLTALVRCFEVPAQYGKARHDSSIGALRKRPDHRASSKQLRIGLAPSETKIKFISNRKRKSVQPWALRAFRPRYGSGTEMSHANTARESK